MARSAANESIPSMDDLASKQPRKAQKTKAWNAKRRAKRRIAAQNVPVLGIQYSTVPQTSQSQPSQDLEVEEGSFKVKQRKRRRRKGKQIDETELSDILAHTNLGCTKANSGDSPVPYQAPSASPSTARRISDVTPAGDHAAYRIKGVRSGMDDGVEVLATTSASPSQPISVPGLRGAASQQDHNVNCNPGSAAVSQQNFPSSVSRSRKVPSWHVDSHLRYNDVPSYNALAIAPLGTPTNRSHTAFSTPSILHTGLGHFDNTLVSTNQPARGLWTGSPPRMTRYNLRSSDTHSRAAERSLSPRKPAHEQPLAKPPGPAKGKSLPAPTPSTLYVSLASLEPTLLPEPQRLLLVLDLNGTLLYRSRASSSYRARPCLQPFLEYCLKHHSVLVWSSATPTNVTNICSRLFTPTQRKQLLGEWGRDTLDLTNEQYYAKCQVYKRLDRVWEGRALRHSHPDHASGAKWSQTNTLLLDDSAVKGQAQPHNLVELPEFTKTGETDQGKQVLGQVVAYLEEARQWADISAFVRKRPFKVDAGWEWNWAEGRRDC